MANPIASIPTTSIYLDEETRKMLADLQKQTGMTRSAQMRHLIHKEALANKGDMAEIRKHVAALRDLVL